LERGLGEIKKKGGGVVESLASSQFRELEKNVSLCRKKKQESRTTKSANGPDEKKAIDKG